MWGGMVEADVSAPIEQVWAIVSDFDGHTRLAGSGEVRAIRMDRPVVAGATFEADVAVGVVGSFTSRNHVDVADAPQELRWTSYPPLDEGETPDYQIEVRWSFVLSPLTGGTRVEHAFEIREPKAGVDELRAFLERNDRVNAVLAGMRTTLENLKAAAER